MYEETNKGRKNYARTKNGQPEEGKRKRSNGKSKTTKADGGNHAFKARKKQEEINIMFDQLILR